jgi:hypothetical protein
MAITDHFRKHGVVHLCWAIGVLTAIIIVLLSGRLGTNNSVKDILAFAVSLTSLVLALIAIIQALVSSGSLSEISTSIRSSIDRINEPVTEISEAARLLNSYSERIDARTQSLEKRLTTIDQQETIKIVPGSQADDKSRFLKTATRGVYAAVYACLRSFETGKAINPLDAFSGTTTQRYIQGCLATFRATELMVIKKVDNAFQVTSLKSFDWLSKDRKSFMDAVKEEYKKEIDGYLVALEAEDE